MESSALCIFSVANLIDVSSTACSITTRLHQEGFAHWHCKYCTGRTNCCMVVIIARKSDHITMFANKWVTAIAN